MWNDVLFSSKLELKPFNIIGMEKTNVVKGLIFTTFVLYLYIAYSLIVNLMYIINTNIIANNGV